ncbi:uncharacterized protein LOC132061568 [Lycium ferocissimum]|uniref:uncharacterized protein LOC132061568 n=1 Tax=Lycium ferocissimum TaxID=112874 RepID=UPI0028159657|nr:uncharacterized protein LOC132061568 [Lycium ferocissimum]
MANFIADTKNKIQDLFVYLVSCGKSSKEPGNEQGLAIDVPGNAQDHGLVIIDISGNAEGQEPIVPTSSEPENSKEQEKENNEMFYGKTVKPDNKAYIDFLLFILLSPWTWIRLLIQFFVKYINKSKCKVV